MPELYIDADACPVKNEAVRVAERHGLVVHLVSNQWMRGPDGPLIRRVVVPEGPDAADDWIAETIQPGDIAITADIPLAARCIERGATVLAPNGKIIDEGSVGMAVAMRDLMTQLRETGEITGGPRGFTPRDRARFLDALEKLVRAARR